MDQETLDLIGLGGGSSSSGSSWESWFQKAGSAVIGVVGQNQQSQNNFELEKLKMQSMNPYGAYYKDGQPMMQGAGGLNPSTLLILGAVVVAVMMLKD